MNAGVYMCKCVRACAPERVFGWGWVGVCVFETENERELAMFIYFM